jgi:tRNA-dihydrouridine synthase B
VLRYTGADALMIGRAAQGRPWIFREIAHFLATGEHLPAASVSQVKQWLIEHLLDHYSLYGELAGMRTARKHIGWAVKPLTGGEAFRNVMNRLESCEEQMRAVSAFLDAVSDSQPLWPALEPRDASDAAVDTRDSAPRSTPRGETLDAANHASIRLTA